MPEALHPIVRRVVTGTDGEGRSVVAHDGPCDAVAPRPDGSQVMDVWRMPAVPPRLLDGDGLVGGVAGPDLGGLVYRLCWVAPNDDMDAAAYARALADTYGDGAVAGAASGMVGGHATESVDVVTVVRGRLTAVLEAEEVELGPGDSLVQRGTVHAWRNRTDEPVLMVALMVGAAR
ncbi:cupin domain-containing protein [Tsukamurella sp. NPDC003166]|uniref:cupin domain-containing protein n=1 Tax=Tsukamurella sp. NPDC003166 TaxID=3154444 RepID=UPI0033B075EF